MIFDFAQFQGFQLTFSQTVDYEDLVQRRISKVPKLVYLTNRRGEKAGVIISSPCKRKEKTVRGTRKDNPR